MRSGLSRKIWLAVMLAIVTASVAAAFLGPPLHRTMLLGSGFTAQTLCAGVFVSGRDAQQVLAEDLRGAEYELLRFYGSEIDRENKRVTASLNGFAGQIAIFREGLGCTLLDGRTEAELRAESDGLFPRTGPPSSDALWPEGERVERGPLPDDVKGAEVEKAIGVIFAEPDPHHPWRTRAIVVVHQGRIVAERYAPGFNAHMPLIGWSMSKTATNALVGLRVGDGRIVASENALMPEWRDSNDSRRAITLDEMMRMTSGLVFNESYDDDLSDVAQMLFVQGNAATFAASKTVRFSPGTHWSYSSGSTNIISHVLRETFADRRDYLRYPQERLFAPLGMTTAVLQPDASGTFIGSSFLYAWARDWARLGLFFLRDGVWQGAQLLPEGWVDYSLTPTAAAPQEQYGAQVWLKLPESAEGGEPPMPANAYYMLGHDQQIVAIVPSRDLVIVRLGLTRQDGDWDSARELAPIVNAFPVTHAKSN